MKLPRFSLRELFLLVFAAACLCWGVTQYRTTLEIRAIRNEANSAEKRAEEAIKRASEAADVYYQRQQFVNAYP
jgi:hypothetical protein